MRNQEWTDWMPWTSACAVLHAYGAMTLEGPDPRAVANRLVESGLAESRKIENGHYADWRFRKPWFKDAPASANTPLVTLSFNETHLVAVVLQQWLQGQFSPNTPEMTAQATALLRRIIA